MAYTFEETYFDAEQFLHQTDNFSTDKRAEKREFSLQVLKKRIISTDALVKKYHLKSYNLAQTQRMLTDSKAENKQICVNYQNALGKCDNLEKECQALRDKTGDLEKHVKTLENSQAGAQSYAKQLEALLKERETSLDSMKIEKKLDKSNLKYLEKKISNIQKDRDQLVRNLQNIANIVLNKKKLNRKAKQFLLKYRNPDATEGLDSEDDNTAGDCNAQINNKTINDSTQNRVHSSLRSTVNEIDPDSDIDTGKGSSLEDCYSDKCYNSPDYFIADSPLNIDAFNNKTKKIDSTTSPINVRETTDMATSPVTSELSISLLDDEIANTYKSRVVRKDISETTDKATSPVTFELEKSLLDDSPQEKIDRCTSPTKLLPTTVSVGVVTSPVKVTEEIITFEKYVECRENDIEFLSADKPTRKIHGKLDINENDVFVRQKECLEEYNSNNLNSNDSTNLEIEDILDDMRISYDLVTPIPPSPKKSIAAPTGTMELATEFQGVDLIAALNHIYQEVTTLKSYVFKNNPSHGINDGNNDQIEYHVKRIFELSSNGVSGERNSLNNVFKKAFQSYNRNNFSVSDDNQSGCYLAENNENVAVSPIRSPDPEPENNNNLSSLVTESSPLKTCGKIQFERDACLSLETRPQNMRNDIAINYHTSQEIIQDSANISSENGKQTKYGNKVSLSLETRPQNTKNDVANNSHSSKEIIQNPANNLLEDGKKISKAKKLTKLQKLREKMIPKCRIKKADPSPPKRLRQLLTSKYCTNMDASKDAFANAVKIYAEQKSKQNTDFMNILEPDAMKRNNRKKNNPIQMNDSENAVIEIESQRSTESGAEKDNVDIRNILNTVEPIQGNGSGAISKKSYRNTNTEVDATKNNNDSKSTSEKTDLQHGKKQVFNKIDVYTGTVKPVEKNGYETPYDDCLLADVKKSIIERKCIPVVQCEKLPILEIRTMSVRGRSTLSSLIDIKTDTSTNEAKPAKRSSIDKSEIQTMRVLRSSTTRNSIENDNSQDAENDISDRSTRSLGVNQVLERKKLKKSIRCALVSYDDMDIFSDEASPNNVKRKTDIPQNKAKSVKHSSIDNTDTQTTRVLRSSAIRNSTENDNPNDSANDKSNENCQSPLAKNKALNRRISRESNTCALVSYDDMDIFNDVPSPKKRSKCENEAGNVILSPQHSILCKMIDKHGLSAMKCTPKKISGTVVTAVCVKIEDGIAHIIELPTYEARPAMDKLVDDLQKWRLKEFLLGLIQYLSDPTRKDELFKKISTPPAPDMTKQEQILLYLITRLNIQWPDIVNCILNQIEYTLFKLNESPDFGVIDSMSHFYAVLCRYIKAKSRLRLFVLDAMYCLQFKSIPLVKQCIEVWWHILPLAHMGIAKSPIVTCMVYVLHYYKCDDRYNRVQEIRNLLNKKYFYQITEWNEPKMLEMFKTAIKELKDNPVDMKMLRLSFIILAKRHGPKWCQNKLINQMLQPIITKEKVPERIKAFCVSMLGPLMKPYPVDMKVNCEVVINQLIDMLDHNPGVQMQEAIFTSLISLSKYNQNNVIQTLLAWQPKQMSLDMELLLRDYVKEKPVQVWKRILSKIPLGQ